MNTPEDQNTPPSPSAEINVTPPETNAPNPKANISLKPIAPAAVAPVIAAPASPSAAAPVTATAAPVAQKPKLNLNVAPRVTTSDLNTKANVQKIPDRKYASTITEDEDQPSAVVTIIAGLAAAAAITFAILLFLKTQ